MPNEPLSWLSWIPNGIAVVEFPNSEACLPAALQEDEPVKTAEHLQQFLHRFRVGEPPMVIPRAAPGVSRVLPVVGGPLHEPAPAAARPAPQ